MHVERVEQGTQDTTLWGSYVQGDACCLKNYACCLMFLIYNRNSSTYEVGQCGGCASAIAHKM